MIFFLQRSNIKLQEENLAKDERIRTLESKFEQIETERRKRNLIIHGIGLKERETDIRSVFDELGLCGDLEVDFRARDCGYITHGPNSKQPGEIYRSRSISRLKELPKWQGVTISDDLSPEKIHECSVVTKRHHNYTKPGVSQPRGRDPTWGRLAIFVGSRAGPS